MLDEMLDKKGVKIDKVLHFEVPDSLLVSATRPISHSHPDLSTCSTLFNETLCKPPTPHEGAFLCINHLQKQSTLP